MKYYMVFATESGFAGSFMTFDNDLLTGTIFMKHLLGQKKNLVSVKIPLLLTGCQLANSNEKIKMLSKKRRLKTIMLYKRIFVTNITKDERINENTDLPMHCLTCDYTVEDGETEKQVERVLSDSEYNSVVSNGYYEVPDQSL